MTVQSLQALVFALGWRIMLPLLGGEGRGEVELFNCLSNIGKLDFWLALILTFSPREKEPLSTGSGFADDCPTNPVARILKWTADDSPSPWRRGPG